MIPKSDWLPGTREGRLAMAKTWKTVLAVKAAAWEIPSGQVNNLDGALAAVAQAETVYTATPTRANGAQVRMAYKFLEEAMRELHAYFREPQLNEQDFISLLLKPPDKTKSRKPRPTGWAVLTAEPAGPHQLMVYAALAPDAPPDPEGSNYGLRVYYGIMPPGGASVEAATGEKRELMSPPASGEQLPHSVFFRGRKYLFDFGEENSGKTAFFNSRYENARGEAGSFGVTISAIIP